MTPAARAAHVTPADLRQHRSAVTRGTTAAPPACDVTASARSGPCDGPETPMGVLGVRTEHRYQTCRDEDCQRFACRVYREGFRDGYGAGHAAGHAEGYATGYAEGHGAGMAEGAAAGAKSG